MHNELVSYIQSNHAADGVEVRAVGPKAVTLALPPELHDVGNLCGELEVRFNARIDIQAADSPGLGPTATVWVMQGQIDHDRCDTDSPVPGPDPDNVDAAPPQEPVAPPSKSVAARFNRCNIGAIAIAALTVTAAAVSILSNGAALWKHLEL